MRTRVGKKLHCITKIIPLFLSNTPKTLQAEVTYVWVKILCPVKFLLRVHLIVVYYMHRQKLFSNVHQSVKTCQVSNWLNSGKEPIIMMKIFSTP